MTEFRINGWCIACTALGGLVSVACGSYAAQDDSSGDNAGFPVATASPMTVGQPAAPVTPAGLPGQPSTETPPASNPADGDPTQVNPGVPAPTPVTPTIEPSEEMMPVTPVTPVGPTPGTPGAVFDLSLWKLTLPVDDARELFFPLLGIEEVLPYYRVSDDDKAVVFQVHAGGDRTSGSKFPRSELREMQGGLEANWSTDSGRHIMETEVAILHIPKNGKSVAVAQIHDADDDVVMIRLDGKELKAQTDGTDIVTFTKDYKLGEWVKLKFDVQDGEIKIFYNGSEKDSLNTKRENCFFKAGAYNQSNTDEDDKDDYSEVMIRALTASHQP